MKSLEAGGVINIPCYVECGKTSKTSANDICQIFIQLLDVIKKSHDLEIVHQDIHMVQII